MQSLQSPRMPDGVGFITFFGCSSVTTTGARQTVWYSSQNWMPPVKQSAVGNTHFVKCTQVKQIPCFFLVMASSLSGDADSNGKSYANRLIEEKFGKRHACNALNSGASFNIRILLYSCVLGSSQGRKIGEFLTSR